VGAFVPSEGSRMRLAPLRRTAALAAVLCAVGSIVTPTSASAHPGLPNAVFDQNEVGWTSVQDLSSPQFTLAVDRWRAKGYLPIDIDIDVLGTDYRASAVLQRNTDGRDWWLYRDLTESQYRQTQVEADVRGYRQSDVESYVLGGDGNNRRYAGVWVKNIENLDTAVALGLTDADFGTWVQQQRTAGRMPVALEQYTGPGLDFRYAAVAVQNTANVPWELSYGLTAEAFTARLNALGATHRPLVTNSVPTLIGQHYGAIWVQNTNGRQWRERHDMDAASYANYQHYFSDLGFRPISQQRYWTSNGTRYAAVWRQDGARMNWAQRGQVDSLVQAARDATDVPGISVAVMQHGVLRYARGFGHADIAHDVWMDSEHVVGLASVSKAVAGVLMMRLGEEGYLTTADPTRKWLPDIPAQHTHTLGQLADIRGCVEHYGEGHGFGTHTPYATSLASAKEFWNDPLVCTVGTEHYSTHGYTILCAAFEAATGRNTVDLINKELRDPFVLGTLGPEQLSDTSFRRAGVYNDDNTPMTRPDRTAKICGGGMESSARDLASFGHKLLNRQIISGETLSALWGTGSFSYGWGVGTVNGHQVRWKDGANDGTQSYLRIYPDDDIEVAVLSNRKGGGHDTGALATAIGDLVAAGA
jgi:CubicO group peptidase (beta-lactamase class C family)